MNFKFVAVVKILSTKARMAAFAAFILAAAANAADVPSRAPSGAAASAAATVIIVRAERVNVHAETNSASRSVRREAGKVAVDFH